MAYLLELTDEEREFLVFKLQWDREELISDPSKFPEDLSTSAKYAALLGEVIQKLGADPHDASKFVVR